MNTLVLTATAVIQLQKWDIWSEIMCVVVYYLKVILADPIT